METPWRPVLLLLCVLMGVRGDDGDFDLADALDDPVPTKKPGGGGLYPKLPEEDTLGVFPAPRPHPPPEPRPPVDPRPPPQPHPRPRPHPGQDGFGGGSSGHSSHGDSYGGNAPTNYHNTEHGNRVAQIVSPNVSVLVLAVVGLGASYCGSGLNRFCRRRSPESAPV